jgi:hypothetical protein
MSPSDKFQKAVDSFGDKAAPELKQVARDYTAAVEEANKALNEKQAAAWAKRVG